MTKIIAKPYTVEQALEVLTPSEIRIGLTYALGLRYRTEQHLYSATSGVMPRVKEMTPKQIEQVAQLFPPPCESCGKNPFNGDCNCPAIYDSP